MTLPTRKNRKSATTLEGESTSPLPETALLSESSLATDWNRVEEDKARLSFQREQFSRLRGALKNEQEFDTAVNDLDQAWKEWDNNCKQDLL